MKENNYPVIVSAVRTPIGSFGGTLAHVSATDLGALVIEEAVARCGIEKQIVQEVIMGMVLPCGYGQNPARQAAIKAGIPLSAGCITINKVCGSSLMSVVLASEMVKSGYAEIIVAGGMENMSMAPYFIPKARWGARMGDAKLCDHMIHDGLWDIINDFHMGISNDLISEKYNISREEQDRYALQSYNRALLAMQKGLFNEEIIPVKVRTPKEEKIFSADECPRPTSLDLLSSMKPAFQANGFATAGNSSKISDGAAAVVIMSNKKAKDIGIKPLARIIAGSSDGIELQYVLMAPINSIPKTCRKAGIALSQIDLHEINEAFSGSTIAVLRALKLDENKVNVNGGCVALGHPIGASGARVLTTLLYEMKRRNATLGEASLCLGGGEAVTLIVENI